MGDDKVWSYIVGAGLDYYGPERVGIRLAVDYMGSGEATVDQKMSDSYGTTLSTNSEGRVNYNVINVNLSILIKLGPEPQPSHPKMNPTK
jgi:hypothetical protein